MLFRSLLVVAALLVALPAARAEPLPLSTAQGEIDKVGKDSLIIRPRGKDGKFEKNITLKLATTSKVAKLVIQNRGGKMVPTQTETDPKDLQAKQGIAVIYVTLPDGPVLLSAVVHPPER
jgi:hypothetical protein